MLEMDNFLLLFVTSTVSNLSACMYEAPEKLTLNGYTSTEKITCMKPQESITV